MSLETILKNSKSMFPILLVAPLLSCSKSCAPEPIPHFEVKYGVTDSLGVASFVDDQTGEDVDIYVKSESSSGNGVADALVVFFDGDGSEAFYSEHSDYNTPDFQIYEHNSSHTLVLTGTTWVGWSVNPNRNEELYSSTRQFMQWVTKEKNNGWGYFGCSKFEEIEEGRKLASVILTGANSSTPIGVVNSYSETFRSVLGIFIDDLEMKEATEYEAFHFFGFIPNLEGYTTPTGGMVFSYGVTPESYEIYTDNGVDDDCDGQIDEIDSEVITDDTGENTSGIFRCSGAENFCDDFEDGNFDNNKWTVYDWDDMKEVSDLPEENGRLRINGPYKVYTKEFDTPIVSGNYSIDLETRVYPGSDFYLNVYLPGTSNGITVEGNGSTVNAYCFDNSDGEESVFVSGAFDLEIKVSQNHSYIYVNDSLVLSQDDCMNDVLTSPGSKAQVSIANRTSGDDLEVEYLSVSEWVGR